MKICAFEGCTAEVPPTNRIAGRQRMYCDYHSDWKKHGKIPWEKRVMEHQCQWPGCTNTWKTDRWREDMRIARYCKDPRCHTKRKAAQQKERDQRAKGSTGEDQKPKKATNRPKDKRISLDINRGSRPGFFKYMEARPFYLSTVFPGMSAAEAWTYVNRLQPNIE